MVSARTEGARTCRGVVMVGGGNGVVADAICIDPAVTKACCTSLPDHPSSSSPTIPHPTPCASLVCVCMISSFPTDQAVEIEDFRAPVPKHLHLPSTTLIPNPPFSLKHSISTNVSSKLEYRTMMMLLLLYLRLARLVNDENCKALSIMALLYTC